MTKTYSFVDISQPINCVATPVAGGTLVAGTTYYYIIIGVIYAGASTYSWWGKSKASAEFSGTADAINKSMQITFDIPVGEAGAYRIFRMTASQYYKTNIVIPLDFIPTDAIYNSAGTVTFTDTGAGTREGNCALETDNDPHGVLTISGSSDADKFSIVDLYDADQTNGWGLIEKLDYDTYKVNTHLVISGTNYWSDIHKTIIFADGFKAGSSFHATFGGISGNLTKWGCKIVISSAWLCNVTFGQLNAYRTDFNYVFPTKFYYGGLGYAALGFYSGTIQDCSIDKLRGFHPIGNTNCTFNNCIFSKFDNLFGGYSANFNDVKLLSGSRIWQIGGSTTNVVARGVDSEGTAGVLVVNGVTGSSLTIIDSVITGTPMFGNYAGNDGFKYYDQFSFNLLVCNVGSLTPIEGVTVKIYDNTGLEVFSVNTDSNGKIVEQFVTKIEGTAIYPDYIYEDKFPYILKITKAGYQIYSYKFTMSDTKPINWEIALKRLPLIAIVDNLEMLPFIV